MPEMVTRRIVLHRRTREKLQRDARQCQAANTRIRYRIVLLADEGWSGRKIAKALGCTPSTVSRTLKRFERYGQAGLIDPRAGNGQRKTDELYAPTVGWGFGKPPRGFFHP